MVRGFSGRTPRRPCFRTASAIVSNAATANPMDQNLRRRVMRCVIIARAIPPNPQLNAGLSPMNSSTRVSAGLPFPLGATWDGSGVNVAVFSANATKIELCLFDADGQARDRPHRAAGVHPRGLARLFPRPAPRPALRAARARALRARGRAPLQPEQAPARPLRPGARGRAPLARLALRLPDRPSASRICPSTGATARGRCRSAGSSIPPHTWGADRPPRRPWAETVIYEAHVKGMTESHPDFRNPRRRHLRGARLAAGGRAPGEARGDGDRAHADPGLLRRPPPGREGARQLLGLQHHRLLRPGAALPDAAATTSPSSSTWCSGCTRPGSR